MQEEVEKMKEELVSMGYLNLRVLGHQGIFSTLIVMGLMVLPNRQTLECPRSHLA